MITESQKKDLLEIIGAKHIAKISKFFVDQGITNRDQGFYSTTVISRVFNGKDANPTIVRGIWQFIAHIKEEREANARLIEECKELSK